MAMTLKRMRRPFGVAALLFLSLFSSAAWASDLQSEVAAMVRAGKVAGKLGTKADVGVSIRELSSLRVVASVGGGESLIPASNQKLLTTGAVLLTLGPGFVFETALVRDGDRLIVVGSGDPNFGDPSLLARIPVQRADGTRGLGMRPEEFVDLWAAAVAGSGTGSGPTESRAVAELVVDDRIFAREGPHPSWPADQLDEDYCAFPSGIAFHANMFSVRPSVRGNATVVETIPPSPWVSIDVRVTTKSGAKDKHSPWLRRSEGDASWILQGNLKSNKSMPIEVCLQDPALYFGQLLASRLQAHGVTVGTVRIAKAGETLARSAHAAPPVRTSLADALARANTDSSNLHAESLLKHLAVQPGGPPASWQASCEVLATMLSRELGAEATGFVVADGSGLARSNRVTTNGMTAWLARIDRDPASGPMLRESMAKAGHTGSVRSRMRDLSAKGIVVPCKTGYIHGVCALSGFVNGPDGRQYAFSIIGNDLTAPGAVSEMKKLQDAIVRRVATGS
ncbi:MAG: D-alanyl-D-alanine carboxypeptidase/D-alanyl-D-alanine-endopeptidase [Planctomycetota bacterium]|nr:D-alanyl-D-alanine carboxypeptidase/D-alanyl-D-alanine-endopeptidase [Planctomycetota bacterium]MDA1105593.1 D-alanyl-D-alanine carboxypeptidase/D-alanyl-D-alanine-endopeptidase [Planctomycetota bacterium]